MDLEGVRKIIEQLRGGAASHLSYEQVREQVLSLAMEGVHQTYTISDDLSIQRARWIKGKKWFASVEELGPPSPGETLDYGRCHQPNRPLCYCSLNEEITLSEIAAELGELYVISSYILPKGTIVVPVGELDHVRRTGETYIGHGNPNASEPYLRVLEEENGVIPALIDAFFANEFSKPATTWTDYKITSALSDVLLNGDLSPCKPTNAIIYPSVRFREGKNFAILPEFHKTRMQLDVSGTKIFRVTDVIGYGIFGFKAEAQLMACDGEGNLTWHSV